MERKNVQEKEMNITHYYPLGGIIAYISKNHLSGLRRLLSERAQRYDYGARQYDCTAPHFTTPDPLAEKYYGWNIYSYCMNNPVNRIDPDGNVWYVVANQDYLNIDTTPFKLNDLFKRTSTKGSFIKYAAYPPWKGFEK